jgi:phosphoribosylformylglycinamidine (FGAM) synthase-like enzyme
VVGGNVSLYNEGGGGPIYPTPIVGMVGKLPDPSAVPLAAFAEQGHVVAVVGPFRPALEGSELEKLRGALSDSLPEIDLAEQAAGLDALRAAARAGTLATVHDIADGGLAVALAECCMESGLGARVDLVALAEAASGNGASSAAPTEALLFGEAPGGAVIAGPAEAVKSVPGARVIGEVGGDVLDIAGALRLPVADLRDAYEGAIPAAFARPEPPSPSPAA